MIEITGLVKHHGTLRVLDGASLTIARGEVAALIGPSGSGKSTLLRCVNALEPFDEGEVRVGDMLHIQNESGEFDVEVLALSQQRGPASVAQTLYRETEESKEKRKKTAEERRLLGPLAYAPAKRPTKRDRRLIHNFSGKRS